MEGEDTRALKQKYLKDKILSAGYDKIKFANFMVMRRTNGTDVDVWEMDELMEVVEDFIRQQESEAGVYSEPVTDIPDKYKDLEEDHDEPYQPSPYEHEEEHASRSPLAPPMDIQFPSKSEDVPRYATFVDYGPRDDIDNLAPESQPKKRQRDQTMSFFSRREQIMSGMPVNDTIVEDESPGNEEDQTGEGGQGNINLRDEVEDSKPHSYETAKPKQEYKGDNRSSEEERKEIVSPRMARMQTHAEPYTVPGLKLPLTELNRTKNLKVEVVGSEVIDEGFFSAKYLSFKLKVLPWDTVIERRDKDFNVLHDYFVKAFPHILIPPINGNSTTKKFDEWYTHKRKFIIKRFMNK